MMGAQGLEIVGDQLIKPTGLMLSVCDFASVLNQPMVMKDAWAFADAVVSDPMNRLFGLNEYFAQQMRSGRGVTWILVLWGVYRLRVALFKENGDLRGLGPTDVLIGNVGSAVMDCSSGELGWLDLEADPTRWQPLARVRPGLYQVQLLGKEGPSHWDLPNIESYPPGDVDWTLAMRRVG